MTAPRAVVWFATLLSPLAALSVAAQSASEPPDGGGETDATSIPDAAVEAAASSETADEGVTSTEDEAPEPPTESTSLDEPAGGRPSDAGRLPHPRYASTAATSSRPSVDDEIPVAYPRPNEPLGASAEVAIGFAPGFGFGATSLGGAAGALGALGGIGLAGHTDFVFAASPRAFFGVGLAVSHNESTVEGFPGAGINQNRLDVPLIAQIYFDDPRRGAAVPTLRVIPAFRWETEANVSTYTRSALGGRLDFGVGVTWFMAEWIALRFLGDLGASVVVNYEGPRGNSVAAYVAADIGIVVRL